jgi:hypothetical protein
VIRLREGKGKREGERERESQRKEGRRGGSSAYMQRPVEVSVMMVSALRGFRSLSTWRARRMIVAWEGTERGKSNLLPCQATQNGINSQLWSMLTVNRAVYWDGHGVLLDWRRSRHGLMDVEGERFEGRRRPSPSLSTIACFARIHCINMSFSSTPAPPATASSSSIPAPASTSATTKPSAAPALPVPPKKPVRLSRVSFCPSSPSPIRHSD